MADDVAWEPENNQEVTGSERASVIAEHSAVDGKKSNQCRIVVQWNWYVG